MKGHIRQRGPGSWELKFDVGADPVTGRRITRYKTVRGAKRDAQQELRRLLTAVDVGTYVEPNRLTIAELLTRWLVAVEPNVRSKTYDRYQQIVTLHLKPTLGRYKIASLQPIHIAEAWSKALSEGRLNGTGGLSAQTVKHHHRVLSQALRWGVRLQLLARNPAELVDAPRPQREEMKILSPEQTGEFLRAIEQTDLYVPVLLAVSTGMRRGEILGLRWADVDLAAGALSIAQTLTQSRQGIEFQSPKTPRSRRRIALPELTVETLRHHRIRQTETFLRIGRGRSDGDLVVCRATGEPIPPDRLSSEFAHFRDKNGLPGIRFHDLRHSHISHLLLAGIHPKVASERAGHASVGITLDVYSHLLPGMQEDAARRTDALLRTGLERKN